MTATSTLAVLASLSFNHDYSFSLTINPFAIGVLVLLAFIIAGIRWWWFGQHSNFELDTADMGIGSHKISFKPNLRDQEIAYKIWVELSTRKIGLPIDLEHDVISEIYDSWHDFFSITRELIKDIPVNKVKHKSTRQIISLSITLLNNGLRPHLTTWQARFRRWYDRQLANAKDDIDPQSIQNNYPKFEELKRDMEIVNKRLIMYREKMRELVLGLSDENIGEVSVAAPTL